jgi:hypothetical protein
MLGDTTVREHEGYTLYKSFKIPYLDQWVYDEDISMYGEREYWDSYCEFFDKVVDMYGLSVMECHNVMDIYFNSLIKKYDLDGQW